MYGPISRSRTFALTGALMLATMLLVVLSATNAAAAPTTKFSYPEGQPSLTKPALFNTLRPHFDFASSSSGSTFICQVDNAAETPCTSPYTLPTPVTANNLHMFKVRASDSTGVGPTTFALFTVDVTPPHAALKTPASAQTLAASEFSVTWAVEPNTLFFCVLDNVSYFKCGGINSLPPLTDGLHVLRLVAFDQARNRTIVTRAFKIATPKPAMVSISEPTSGVLAISKFTAHFTATVAAGQPASSFSFVCKLQDDSLVSTISNAACADGQVFDKLPTGHSYTFTVTATDLRGTKASATSAFQTTKPGPALPSVDNLKPGRKDSNNSPQFDIYTQDSDVYPNVTFECAIVGAGSSAPSEGAYASCGDGPYSQWTVPAPLPIGSYELYVRERAGALTSAPNASTFRIYPWTAPTAVEFSTVAAGAHPDIDVHIAPTAGELAKTDFTLPKGVIGSLNSFPKCGLAAAAALTCPAASKIGDSTSFVEIAGGAATAGEFGNAYLAEALVPGDAASISIPLASRIPAYDTVLVSLRVQLINNSQQMRILGDAIPMLVRQNVADYLAPFALNDFTLHIDGDLGAPYPFLTNPTNCVASQTSVVQTDSAGNRDSQTIPFQATGCASLPFSPTISQTFSRPAAGASTAVNAKVTLPAGSSSIKTLRVNEPAFVGPSFPSFGASADQCPPSAAPIANSVFDPTNCPAASLVGDMTISSPVLPAPLTGSVYLINRSPLPWLGIKLDQPSTGVSVRLTGVTSTPQVDPTCDPTTDDDGFCPTQIAIVFNNLPDLPYSDISFTLGGHPRTGSGGVALSGDILTVATPSDETCVSGAAANSTFTPSSGIANLVRAQPISITGCLVH